jgi:hypothetical protein
MNDIEQAAESLEGIKHGLLLRRKRAGSCFGREFAHKRVVAFGEPDPEQCAGSARSNFSPKINDSLPDFRIGVGRDGLGSHTRIVSRCRFLRKSSLNRGR